jgi:hypothetical protein
LQCTGNGLWNLAVAAQTFYVLVLGKVTPSVVKWIVVTFIVVFQTCMTVVGPIISYRANSPFPFYGPNPVCPSLPSLRTLMGILTRLGFESSREVATPRSGPPTGPSGFAPHLCFRLSASV